MKSKITKAIASLTKALEGLNDDERVEAYNAVVRVASEAVGMPHPCLCPQLVPVETVKGNDYNPNKVAPPEMRLLELSIRKDGLTMPVVVASASADAERHEVVDGFHRRTIVAGVQEIRGSLRGYLPIWRYQCPSIYFHAIHGTNRGLF